MNRPNLLAKATERVSRVIGLRSSTTTSLALLLAALVPSTTHATLGVLTGTGSSADPYQVADYADLAVVATGTYAKSASYRLTADIDATPSDTANARKGFLPISFSGTFHGAGHKISMLSIHRSGQDAGLFLVLESAALVDSLELVGASISGSRHVGVLAASNHGTIRGCTSSGTVVGDSATGHVGGLVGTNTGTIRDSRSSSKDSGDSGITAGGLVGWNSGAIESSHATGTVTAGHFAGGLVGFNTGVVNACTASGAISGNNLQAHYGGLVGSTSAGRIHGCKASGAVEAYGDFVSLGGLAGLAQGTWIDSSKASGAITAHADHAVIGGFVGQSGGSILRAVSATGAVTATGLKAVAGGLVGATSSGDSLGSCYATGGTTATGLEAIVGGLVGRSDSANIAICYATGAVTTTGTNALAGGLVGSSGIGDKIRYSYASGPVTATGTNVFAGGLVGLNRGTIDACYAVSKVVNSESAFLPGGLVGNDSGSILASYWGLETSSSIRGVGYGVSTGSATGLIVVAMAQPTSFAGWDFSNTWMLGSADTVPLLRALASSYGSPVGVDPATARVRHSWSWKRTGNRLTVEVPGESFEVVVSDLNGRILAHASGTGTAELELKSSRSLIVGIHSNTVNESFAIGAIR